MWPLTHVNLNEDIIKYLGVGIVRFCEDPEPINLEVEATDCEYRVDTDVITSVKVSGGVHTPDNPVTVNFLIDNVEYVVNNVVYPESESQLVWVKWHTPKKEKTLNISVTVSGDGATASKTSFKANIVSLDENVPPNPTADDRNDTFKATSLELPTDVSKLTWGVWSCSWKADWVWYSNWVRHFISKYVDGEFIHDYDYWSDDGKYVDEGDWEYTYTSYQATLDAKAKVTPDEHCPTATETTLGVGYGFTILCSTKMETDSVDMTTNPQTAVTYFPEFNYNEYWRLLERTKNGQNAEFEFQNNEYSTYNSRVHFTPLWMPDQIYNVYTVVMDAWTPVGMLCVHRDWAVVAKKVV